MTPSTKSTLWIGLFLAGCGETPTSPVANTSAAAVETSTATPAASPVPPQEQSALPANPLPTDVSANLIFAALRYNCNASMGVQGVGRAEAAWDWALATFIETAEYSVIEDRPPSSVYPNNRMIKLIDHQGSEFTLGYWKSGAPTDVTQINYCGFRVARIRILDTTLTPNGKEAEIVYTQEYEPSKIATLIQSSGFQDEPVRLPAPTQRQAVLRKLDATGWQVQRLF